MALLDKLKKLLASEEKNTGKAASQSKPAPKPAPKPAKESKEIEAAKKEYASASKKLRELRKNAK